MDSQDEDNADCTEPQDISGVSTSERSTQYKLRKLKRVQYSHPLPGSSGKNRNICSRSAGPVLTRRFYHQAEKSEENKCVTDVEDSSSVNRIAVDNATASSSQASPSQAIGMVAATDSPSVNQNIRLFDDANYSHPAHIHLAMSELPKFEFRGSDIKINYLTDLYMSFVQNKNDLQFPDSFSQMKYLTDHFVLFVKNKNDRFRVCESLFKTVFFRFSSICNMVSHPVYYDEISGAFEGCTRSYGRTLFSDPYTKYNMCPVLSSIFMKNKCFLKGLLDFGLQKKDFSFFMLPYHKAMMREYPVYAAFKPISRRNQVRLDASLFNIRDHLLFEIIILICLIRGNLHDVEWVHECMAITYKAIPYPYVSVSEIVSKLNFLNPNLPAEEVDFIVYKYKSLFHEASEGTCPRSLKDLCRCTIRASFKDNYSVKEAGNKVNLPLPLVAFINIEGSLLETSDSDDDHPHPSDDFTFPGRPVEINQVQ